MYVNRMGRVSELHSLFEYIVKVQYIQLTIFIEYIVISKPQVLKGKSKRRLCQNVRSSENELRMNLIEDKFHKLNEKWSEVYSYVTKFSKVMGLLLIPC